MAPPHKGKPKPGLKKKPAAGEGSWRAGRPPSVHLAGPAARASRSAAAHAAANPAACRPLPAVDKKREDSVSAESCSDSEEEFSDEQEDEEDYKRGAPCLS